jgi:protein phosphatase 1L
VAIIICILWLDVALDDPVQGDRLSVASVGDSRCVMSDGGTAVALTRDHKASDPLEARRVMQVGR